MATLLGDITANLNSLSFEAGLCEEERDVLYIRKRSHAVRTCMVGQVCYLVAIINEGKRLVYEQENIKVKKAAPKPWKEVPKRKPLRIGILGCGGLGRLLVKNLQKYSGIHPEEILISTRRPELLKEFSETGIKCFFNNKKLVQSTDLTFICCLPSQIDSVIEDIKDNVRCLLFTFVAGIPRMKLCKLLNCSDIIKPEFIFGSKELTIQSTWDFKQSISQALENPSSCELTCPGNVDIESLVKTSKKLVELMIYVMINMMIVHGLSKEDTTKYVNLIVLGPTNDENSTKIAMDHIWNSNTSSMLDTISVNESTYEIFSLDKLHTAKTHIGAVLENPKNELSIRLRKRYVSLFDRFNSWNSQCELVHC